MLMSNKLVLLLLKFVSSVQTLENLSLHACCFFVLAPTLPGLYPGARYLLGSLGHTPTQTHVTVPQLSRWDIFRTDRTEKQVAKSSPPPKTPSQTIWCARRVFTNTRRPPVFRHGGCAGRVKICVGVPVNM